MSPHAAALRAQLEAQRDAIERLNCGRSEGVSASPLHRLLAQGKSTRQRRVPPGCLLVPPTSATAIA